MEHNWILGEFKNDLLSSSICTNCGLIKDVFLSDNVIYFSDIINSTERLYYYIMPSCSEIVMQQVLE